VIRILSLVVRFDLMLNLYRVLLCCGVMPYFFMVVKLATGTRAVGYLVVSNRLRWGVLGLDILILKLSSKGLDHRAWVPTDPSPMTYFLKLLKPSLTDQLVIFRGGPIFLNS
jgi:hypothetical protein